MEQPFEDGEIIQPQLQLRLKDESGFFQEPHDRIYNLRFAIQVFFEFLKGFRALHFVGPCITVFGSARFQENHPFYSKAYQFGKSIAAMGGTVMTGGGPGIMEAANRGAYENGGKSVGCNIKLPYEQRPNSFMHKWVTIRYFFVRKVLLLKYSYGFIVMPGGFGTMDEFFETATLIQTGTIRHFPIVVFGTKYYEPLREFLSKMAEAKTISTDEMQMVLFTDDENEGMDHIRKYLRKHYYLKRQKPFPWLFERRNGKRKWQGQKDNVSN